METISIAKLKKLEHKEKATICATVKEVKQLQIRTGDRMAFVEVEDDTGKTDIVIFAHTYMKVEELVTTHKEPIYFAGEANEGEGDESPRLIVCESIQGFCMKSLD